MKLVDPEALLNEIQERLSQALLLRHVAEADGSPEDIAEAGGAASAWREAGELVQAHFGATEVPPADVGAWVDPTAYQAASARTLPDLRSLHASLDAASTVDPRTLPLLMAAVGLAGEAGEWAMGGHDPAEAGDVLWYAAAVCTALGIDMADVLIDDVDPPPTGANETILGMACLIVEQTKKAAFHGKEINEDTIGAGLVGIMTVLRLVHGDIAPIMAANVAKLQARWPDGFRVQA